MNVSNIIKDRSRFLPYKTLVCLLVLLLWNPQGVQAQINEQPGIPDSISFQDSSRTITLPQAIDIALANNIQVKRALLSVKDADEQVLSAWGEVMPNISTSMSYTRNMEIPVNFVPARALGDTTAPPGQLIPLQFGTDNNWTGGLTVNQTIFRGQAIVGISSSEVYKLVQSENYRATAQQVVTQTRLAFYNVLIAQEQLDLQQASIRRLEKNLAENRARQKAGLIDEYDVLRLEVQLSNQRPRLTTARYQVEKAYRDLKQILGLPLEFQFAVQGDLKQFDITKHSVEQISNDGLKQVDRMTPLVLDPAVGFTKKVFNKRGDLRILDARTELKDREILAAKSRFLPTISASYSLQWNAAEAGSPDFFATEDERARSQAVLLNFSLPLFHGMQRKTAVQRAQIQRQELVLQKEETKRSAKNEIETARETLQQALETEEARHKAIQQAQRGYEIATARLDQGVGSQLDVTNAELQLREAEMNYAQMVYNYLAAKARYDQAVGMVPLVDQNSHINE